MPHSIGSVEWRQAGALNAGYVSAAADDALIIVHAARPPGIRLPAETCIVQHEPGKWPLGSMSPLVRTLRARRFTIWSVSPAMARRADCAALGRNGAVGKRERHAAWLVARDFGPSRHPDAGEMA